MTPDSRSRRRVVCVGAVRGVLARREHRWVVDNEPEVRLLEALRAERGALERLRALAAVLDAGLVDVGDLKRLNGRLSAIAAVEAPGDLWRVLVAGDECAAVAYACVCAEDEMLSRWLGYALSARLDANLVPGLLPGPGWVSWGVPDHLRDHTLDRDTHWVSEMPRSFWRRLRSHSDRRLRAVARASDPAAHPKLLADLADRHPGAAEVLDVIASNPRAPTRVLRRLMRDPGAGEQVALRVAQNRSATAALLAEMANSRRWDLRYVAAWHPRMPLGALRRLAGDESDEVRTAVARAEAPAPALQALASDPDVWVRTAVASNPSAPQGALEALLGDRFAAVRAAAAANESTPAALVAARARDRAIRVRCEVAARPVGSDVLTVLAEDPKSKVRQAVAHNAHTPPKMLGRLAKDRCGEVRAAAGHHRDTPPVVLRALAGDDYWWVRDCVASNKSTPLRALSELTSDEDSDVSFDAARNAAIGPRGLKTLAAHEHWAVRAGAALNPNTPQALLEALAQDDDSDVRRCVCENDQTPQGVLDTLRRDADYWVRAAAAAASQRRRAHTHGTAPQRRAHTNGTAPQQQPIAGSE